MGCSVLVLGMFYWVGFAKIWPIFGMSVEVEREEDAAGNEIIRYKVCERTLKGNLRLSFVSRLRLTQT